MDEYERYFLDISMDARYKKETRGLAARLLETLRANTIPSRRSVNLLRKLVEESAVCMRLNADGSCVWLRKNAELEGLTPPRPGEKAFCKRSNTGTQAMMFESCAGYRKRNRD